MLLDLGGGESEERLDDELGLVGVLGWANCSPVRAMTVGALVGKAAGC